MEFHCQSNFVVMNSLKCPSQSHWAIFPVNLHPDIKFVRPTWYFFRVLNFQKIRYPVFCQKARCKNQGHCYSKREKTRLPLPFWITMTRFFATCFLTKNWVPHFFQGLKPTPLFITRIKGRDWLGDSGLVTASLLSGGPNLPPFSLIRKGLWGHP